jgi:hypothetical protein
MHLKPFLSNDLLINCLTAFHSSFRFLSFNTQFISFLNQNCTFAISATFDLKVLLKGKKEIQEDSFQRCQQSEKRILFQKPRKKWEKTKKMLLKTLGKNLRLLSPRL